MANAIAAAERWLYNTLKNDATLAGIVGTRIYGEVVPPGATYPLVFYTMAAGADNRMTVEAYRIWSELVYAVRIVNRVESYLALETGATAIEAALHRESGSNVSGVVIASVYQAPFRLVELDEDGSQVRSLGGIYRLYVQ